MSKDFEPSDLDPVFEPLPDALRQVIARLEPAPPGSLGDQLPDWATTLIVRYSEGELDPTDLPGLQKSSDPEDGTLGMLTYAGVGIEFLPGGQSRTFAVTPKQKEGASWMLPKLSDYWDFNVRALPAGADRLEQKPDAEWPAEQAAIEAALTEQVRVVPDHLLRRAAVSYVDDLYKEASATNVWGGALPVYLHTCAGTLSRLFTERGIRIQYLIDNEYEDMARPLQLFPEWFGYCGFVYACPQAVVMKLAEHDGVAEHRAFGELSTRYIDEARHVVDLAIERAQSEGRHIVQLDTDSAPGSYDVAMRAVREPGTITISRSEAPEPGSHVDIWIADEMTDPS